MAKRKLNRDRLEVDENILKLMRYGEEIKPIRGCNNYYVTSFGRVFSNNTWSNIKPRRRGVLLCSMERVKAKSCKWLLLCQYNQQ